MELNIGFVLIPGIPNGVMEAYLKLKEAVMNVV